jgi:hypothetical protein
MLTPKVILIRADALRGRGTGRLRVGIGGMELKLDDFRAIGRSAQSWSRNQTDFHSSLS